MLNLSSCRQLDADSLLRVLPARGHRLPHLRELDASYCELEARHVRALLTEGAGLCSLALNGVSGVQGAALCCGEEGASSVVPPEGESRLEALSLVKCPGLQALALGLRPGPGCEVLCFTPRRLLLEPVELAARTRALSWLPAPTALNRLASLRLGLSKVQVLALDLPRLTLLDVNGCSELCILELRCPLLLTLYMQACRALPAGPLWRCLEGGCPGLATLDAQQNPGLLQAVARAAASGAPIPGLPAKRRRRLAALATAPGSSSPGPLPLEAGRLPDLVCGSQSSQTTAGSPPLSDLLQLSHGDPQLEEDDREEDVRHATLLARLKSLLV